MAIPAAQRVGKTLARLGHLGALASSSVNEPSQELASRDRILEFLNDSSRPLTVEGLCEASELHSNTVRGHLEVLVAGGFVTRTQGAAKGRGRPPWLYSVDPDARPQSVEGLRAELREELAAADESTLASEAASRWVEIETGGVTEQVDSVDSAVELATDSLNRSGFHAQRGLVGDRIEVTNCPYADLIADQPVICDIHTSLLSQVLEQTKQDVSVEGMDVWARPGVCIAHLNRTDITPARRIQGDDLAGGRSEKDQ